MLQSFIKEQKTVWKFNTPYSSHMGCLLERLIGIARRILDSILFEARHQRLTHEVLCTFMAETTAIMNARPLVPISSDPNSPSILSPNTLLTQKVSDNIEDFSHLNMRDVYTNQWKFVQVLADKFWTRWRQEYLQSLQTRRKWQHIKQNIQVGDVVLLKDYELHRNNWLIGLVERVFPGRDNLIRKVQLRVNFGENEADKLEVLLKKFEDYCILKKNVTVIRHRFNTRVQNSSESIDQYLTDLKLIAKNCEFEHLNDGLIRDRIVCGTNYSRVKERLLREDGLTLDKAVGICRAHEESRKQMKTLNEEEQVHALRRKTQNQRTNRNEGYAKKGPSRRNHEKRESNSSFSCGKCGTIHERRNCSAYGKKCHKCKTRVSQFFKNLKGVETDIDDILVWGTTRKEHDDRLRSVLNRCQEVGLTLNTDKCRFRLKEVTYIGHTLSADGVRPDQEKNTG
ncbi:unnamed protein product [Mytilus coruscus]|uniref:Uncharacterized protein n=1 Tax=Mytilus coruscus TaxID=42192 RepID=A0A6J8BFX4_MYTCO|nr:unnamed protein product [Mytilus coruscus]